MATDIQIKPGPTARSLFGQMAARAETGDHFHRAHLSMVNTLELAVERSSAGKRDSSEIHELQAEGWIKQAPDGGWFLG